MKKGTVASREHAWVVNQRHRTALEQTKESLQRALETITSGLSPEFVAVDLRGALDSLGLIIGATYTEDILKRIFSDFSPRRSAMHTVGLPRATRRSR